MSWGDGPLAPFDLETTGVNTSEDRIVTGCVAIVPPAGDGPRTPKVFSWMADPGIEIPQGATDVHGITTEYAREHGADAPEVIESIVRQLLVALEQGVPIVGANLQYDLTLLMHECLRHRIRPLHERMPDGLLAPVVDVMVIDKAADPYRQGKRKLTNLAEHYRVKLEGAHDSTADALAAGRIAWRMAQGPIQRTPRHDLAGNVLPPRRGDPGPLDVGSMKLSDLHAAQVEWKATQSAGLARYLRGKGESADDVRPEWPFVPVASDDATDKLF